MALYNLRNLLQFLNDLAALHGTFERETNVGASGVADAAGINKITRACDYPQFDQPLNALVDSSSAHATERR